MFLFVFISFFSLTLSIFFGSLNYNNFKLNCVIPLGLDIRVLVTLSLVATVLLLYNFIPYFNNYLVSIGCGLIIGSGIYHILFRIQESCIKDYLNFGDLYFNLPDVFIICGIGILGFFTIKLLD